LYSCGGGQFGSAGPFRSIPVVIALTQAKARERNLRHVIDGPFIARDYNGEDLS
jgi:hypothetical protein